MNCELSISHLSCRSFLRNVCKCQVNLRTLQKKRGLVQSHKGLIPIVKA